MSAQWEAAGASAAEDAVLGAAAGAAEASDAAAGPQRRGPGRPRNADLDDAILRAALELVDAGEDVTVSRVVERSGVSRAALYRRWPSMTSLIAAALDVGRAVPPAIDVDREGLGGELRETILASFFADPSEVAGDYSEARFRRRIRLAMEDRDLQRAYWASHVVRRRAALEDALRRGIRAGVLQPDLDPASCFDLLAGVFYYQLVVRGDSLDDPDVRARCRDALTVAWRGMEACPGPHTPAESNAI